jgi:hypothetical protein
MIHIVPGGHEFLDYFIIHRYELYGVDCCHGFRDAPVSKNSPEDIGAYMFRLFVPLSGSELYRGTQGNHQVASRVHPVLLTLHPIVNHPGTPNSPVVPVAVRILPFRSFTALMQLPQVPGRTVEIRAVNEVDTVVIVFLDRMQPDNPLLSSGCGGGYDVADLQVPDFTESERSTYR